MEVILWRDLLEAAAAKDDQKQLLLLSQCTCPIIWFLYTVSHLGQVRTGGACAMAKLRASAAKQRLQELALAAKTDDAAIITLVDLARDLCFYLPVVDTARGCASQRTMQMLVDTIDNLKVNGVHVFPSRVSLSPIKGSMHGTICCSFAVASASAIPLAQLLR